MSRQSLHLPITAPTVVGVLLVVAVTGAFEAVIGIAGIAFVVYIGKLLQAKT